MMNYPFSRPAPDLNAWSEVTRSLMDAAEEIRTRKHTSDELSSFCLRAAQDALPLNGRNDVLCWGYDDPNTMPGDARCEFFFLPTYVMTQCLISAVLRAPGLMRCDKIRDTLERGLNGCTLRGLCGHGYEADEVCIDNLKAFLKAGYADLIMRYPQISPAFRKVFTGALESFREDYLAGRHCYGWNQNLKAEQEQLLEMAPRWLLGSYAPEPGQHLYVAYGSNMDEAQMEVRCPGARLIGIGTLSRAQLDFYLYATVTAVEDEKATVPVAVWLITEEHEHALDRYEGVRGHYYYKDTATVKLNNGREVEGLIYLMENFRRQPVSDGYYDRIAAAYDRLGLHDRVGDVLEPARERSLDR